MRLIFCNLTEIRVIVSLGCYDRLLEWMLKKQAFISHGFEGSKLETEYQHTWILCGDPFCSL
jgi:hypothetical protein